MMTHHTFMAGSCGRRQLRMARGFTLVEMMASMGLLVFLMLILFRFFGNMQAAWTTSMSSVELYEDARIAMDVIIRDLDTAMITYNDIPGQHIRLHQAGPSTLWFVTSGVTTDTAESSIIEVGYRLHAHRLQRAFVDDSCESWSIYGERDDADDQFGYQTVVRGVVGLQFICYDKNMQQYMPSQDATPPAMISVVLTLLDPRTFRLWERMSTSRQVELQQKSARTFRKTISLTGRGHESA